MMAQQRASGALEISGNPGGSVFMSGGYLTFAESPAVPDLSSRLIGAGRLSAEQWRQIIESDHGYAGVCSILVSRQIMGINELRALLRSIALDALVMLAVTDGTLAADIKFWPRRSHWVGSLLRLEAASVWADVEQKVERLTLHGIPAAARPRCCDLNRPWAVIRNEQWMLAGQVDGLATVKDLAWRNGFALCDAMDQAGELVQAGLCTLASAAPATAATSEVPDPREHKPAHRPRLRERRARYPAGPASQGASPQLQSQAATGDDQPSPGPVKDAALSSDQAHEPFEPLPQRKPGATLVTRATRSGRTGASATVRHVPAIQPPQGPPPPDLWHRILKGLKRTD